MKNIEWAAGEKALGRGRQGRADGQTMRVRTRAHTVDGVHSHTVHVHMSESACTYTLWWVQVFYQEYAQTASCGCAGCNTHTKSGARAVSNNVTCKTVAGPPLDGCKPIAALDTPFVKEMRRNCGWGYAYPFDDKV